MFTKRLQYGILLIGVCAYFLAGGTWLAWILLLVVAGLPWLSLLLSIPAIRSFEASVAGTELPEMGKEAELWLLGSCEHPMPPFRGKIRMRDLLTGEQWRYENEDGLDTTHCGGCRAWVENVKIYDYLGLFSFRVRKVREQTIVIRPKPIPVSDLIDPRRMEINHWVPKPGGGYSENHEHRLYRPGDSLNQVHWKLSAKMDDWIVREPMAPMQGGVLVTVHVQGTPEDLDRKFGRLLWVGQYLLERELDFEIRAMTGEGVLRMNVDCPEALTKAVDTLLCTEASPDGTIWDACADASWQYHVGGQADEA